MSNSKENNSVLSNNQVDVHVRSAMARGEQTELPPVEERSAGTLPARIPTAPAIAPAAVATVHDPNRNLPVPQTYSRALVRVELPDKIVQLVSPELLPAVRSVFRYPPITAGQSIEDYFDLAEAAILEYRVHGYSELGLLKQIVDEDWKIMTFSRVQIALLSAEIAEGILSQLCDVDPKAGNLEEKDQKNSQAPSRVGQWRRIVFAAVSGDEAMRNLIEKQGGYVGFDAFAARHMLEDIRSHIFADNVMNAAVQRKLRAIRDLEKQREARYRRIETNKLTARDVKALRGALPIGEWVLFQGMRPSTSSPTGDADQLTGTSVKAPDTTGEVKG